MREYSLSLLAWAYNEEQLIEAFIRKSVQDLKKVSGDFEIVVVDDGSKDRTWEKLQALAKEFPCLKPVRHERNRDVGEATQSAIAHATKEILFWNTIDMFFDTADLPKFLPHMENYDVLQGVRTDLKANAPLRKLTSIVNYFLNRWLFGVKLSEFQNVKFFKRDFGRSVEFESASVFTNPELIIKAYYQGLRIKEVPMEFHERTAGKQKGAKWSTLSKTLRDILKCWFRWRVLGKIKMAERPGTIDSLHYKIWLPSRW